MYLAMRLSLADTKREEERERREEKINQVPRKDKANWPKGAPESVILPPTGVKRREGGGGGREERKSRIYQREVLSFCRQLSVLLWD